VVECVKVHNRAVCSGTPLVTAVRHRKQARTKFNAMRVSSKEAAQLVHSNDKKGKHLVEQRFLQAAKARTPCALFTMWEMIDKAALKTSKQREVDAAHRRAKFAGKHRLKVEGAPWGVSVCIALRCGVARLS